MMDEREYQLLHNAIVRAAKARRWIPEQAAAGLVGLRRDDRQLELSALLQMVADREHREHRPLLSVLVGGTDRLPRDEFFRHAEQLGLYTDPDSESERQQARRKFANAEMQQVYAAWAPPSWWARLAWWRR
jgi:hypothetical protein